MNPAASPSLPDERFSKPVVTEIIDLWCAPFCSTQTYDLWTGPAIVAERNFTRSAHQRPTDCYSTRLSRPPAGRKYATRVAPKSVESSSWHRFVDHNWTMTSVGLLPAGCHVRHPMEGLLHQHFADLHDRLNIGIVRRVPLELGGVWSKSGCEHFSRVEGGVHHSHEGCG
jgi:hypothetical protein